MKRNWLAWIVLVTTGCSGGGEGGDPGGDDSPAPVFSTSGMVSNPVSAVQSGRLIVGVAKPADVPQKIVCDKLLAKFEQGSATLPAPFQLQGVPAGSFVLVALLIDGSGNVQMPGAAYEVVADNFGVHFASSPRAGGNLDVFMQGTIAFDCP